MLYSRGFFDVGSKTRKRQTESNSVLQNIAKAIKKIRFGGKDYHFDNFNHFLNFMIVIGNLQKLDKLRDEGELEEFNPTTFKSVMGESVKV